MEGCTTNTKGGRISGKEEKEKAGKERQGNEEYARRQETIGLVQERRRRYRTKSKKERQGKRRGSVVYVMGLRHGSRWKKGRAEEWYKKRVINGRLV